MEGAAPHLKPVILELGGKVRRKMKAKAECLLSFFLSGRVDELMNSLVRLWLGGVGLWHGVGGVGPPFMLMLTDPTRLHTHTLIYY